MDVSIVIPTKNGGTLFDRVLDMVFQQETRYQYEVICVDSGSSDDTLEIIRKYPCRLYEIAPKEFGHGKTRNYGASLGTGEFIVFLTQDALPAGKDWLEQLINAMQSDENIAGGFGIHYPYPNCNPLERRDLQLHFAQFGEELAVYWLEDRERYRQDASYRHRLAFFSDNNSCLRRAVWEKYPYEEVAFAEDQIWMKKMMELGFKKVYVPKAPVYHSHNYPVRTYYRRCFDEYKGLYQLHGFVIASSWWLLPLYVLKDTVRDWRYLRSQTFSGRERYRWLRYAFLRNVSRYYGGFQGGNYHSYSRKKQQWLDLHISQQYQQRKA